MAPEENNAGCVALIARLAEVICALDLFNHHDTMSISVVFQDGHVVVVDVGARFYPTPKACDPRLSASSNEMRELVNLAAAQHGLGPVQFGEVACHLKNGNLSRFDFTHKFRV